MTFLPSAKRPVIIYNRIEAIMAHLPRYSFSGRARLAADVGVCRSTISRVLNGRCRPSYALVWAITRALETHVGRPLDPREIFSADGNYPTPSVCLLCGCPGCLPEAAYDREENLRPEYRAVKPGDWSLPTQDPEGGV